MIAICMYRDCNQPLAQSGEHLPYTDMPIPMDKHVSHGICLDCMPKLLRKDGMPEDEIKTFMKAQEAKHEQSINEV